MQTIKKVSNGAGMITIVASDERLFNPKLKRFILSLTVFCTVHFFVTRF